MPDIDRTKLAFAVAGVLKKKGLGLREAARKFEGVSAGSLSRIGNGIEVSAAVLLTVCHHLALDPLEFLDLAAPHPHSGFGKSHSEKRQLNQPVSVPDKRETSFLRLTPDAGASAPQGRAKPARSSLGLAAPNVSGVKGGAVCR